MDLNVQMEVSCPNCSQSSMMEGRTVVGKTRVKTICPCCCFQFHLERETDSQVTVRTSGVFDLNEVYGQIDADDMDWMVDSGFSKGFCYDVEGLASLIRSGLLNPDTRVKPPGTTLSLPANQILQLKPFFQEMNTGKKNPSLLTDITTNEPNTLAEDLTWFQMEDSGCFQSEL